MLTPKHRIFVAGHRGLVGSALVRALQAKGYGPIITRTRAELDLLDQPAVREFLKKEKPDYILLAAARVGGIGANMTYPADFIYENLMVEANVIHGAHQAGVENILFLGSSCIYPRQAPQPIVESALLTGPLEPTNAPYALSKIAGIAMCDAYNKQHKRKYRPVMPTNLYGIQDNFDTENAHVIPALISRFHAAKTQKLPEVVLWGTGTPRREFLYSDDFADACLFLLEKDESLDLINVGTGEDIAIRDLAQIIGKVVGYPGEVRFDTSKPDGMMRKVLSVDRLKQLGWRPRTSLEEGLTRAYDWYLNHQTGRS
jgi:GDP-L-fucose synthase